MLNGGKPAILTLNYIRMKRPPDHAKRRVMNIMGVPSC
jgi:hypothetical protein